MRNSTYFGANGLGLTKPVTDPSRNTVTGPVKTVKLPNLGFLLYGHPDEHGGPGVPLPVLVAIDGDTYTFVSEEVVKGEIVPVDFSDPSFAATEAAKVPRKLRIMSANLHKDAVGTPVKYDRLDPAGDPPPLVIQPDKP